jgi:hypothetical protein
MIKKSIITAVVLLLAYEAVIRLAGIKWDTSQNDKSANLISAQNFIYNRSAEEVKKDTLIIGSSISRKLVTDSLGKNYFNLAFNAWSSYDGLELLRITGKKPACILIETNVVGNQSLQEDVKGSLSPVSYYSSRAFKSFQLQNQPVGLLVGGIKEKLKAKMEAMRRLKRQNQELYDYNVKLEKEKQMQPLPDSEMVKRFTVLKNLVAGFKQQNIQVVFFEIPFDAELENTAINQQNRKYFSQYFPESEYKYVQLPPVNNYVYSDGIHLSVESALPYTLYLKNELEKLKTVNK